MLELVADNGKRVAEQAPPTDAELRLLTHGALVRASKKSPLRAVIVLDLGGGETATITAGVTRAEALRLAGTGVRDMQEHLTDQETP